MEEMLITEDLSFFSPALPVRTIYGGLCFLCSQGVIYLGVVFVPLSFFSMAESLGISFAFSKSVLSSPLSYIRSSPDCRMCSRLGPKIAPSSDRERFAPFVAR